LKRLLAHPLAVPLLGLLASLVVAALLSAFVPASESATFELPGWLAGLLSDSGDTTAVLGRPRALWLMPVAIVPFLVLMARRSLVDAPRFQIVAQVFGRLMLLMALALALALPTLRAPIRGKTVVFVVDVSQSIDDEQLAGARELVAEAMRLADDEEAAGLAREDRTRVRLVTYAGQAQAIDLSEVEPDALVLERDPEHALASNHADGLRLAQAMLDPDTEPRMVLITDGTGSLAERESLAIAVEEVEKRGSTVHTRTFPAKARGDVLVESVTLPEELRVGQSFEVAIDLVSTSPGEIKLHLSRDGTPNPLAPTETVQLRGGRQQIKLPARVTTPGPVVFEARLDTEGFAPALNRSTLNDAAAVVGDVRGRPRVLHVGSDSTGALARALSSDHLSVDNVGPAELPASADGLRPYDLVIFSDLPRRRVSGAQQQAISRYVKDMGGGFMMIGGENSFGVGGWGGSTIEGLLPVKFEGERQREQPTLALVLVIDKSGSMSSEDKLDLVKEAARATARALDPTDEIGVIAFDSRPNVLVRLQRASNRIRISSDIRRLSAGGGTNALPALREAYLQLAGSKALVKHVILLSDGQSPETGINSLIHDMRDADITVSSVGVGAGAGKELLARVAEMGRGRYYFSQDGTDVPRIFSRETREVTRNAIVERELYPRVTKAVQALRGIDFGRAPGLRGIVPVKPKAQAEVLLRTHLGDPLLVRGRRGLGRTLAFASDAKPRWAASWVMWSGFSKLWSQLARDTMRQGASLLGGATIGVHQGATLGSWQVVVDVESPEGFANDLVGEVEIIDPALAEDDEARKRSVPLELSAPGRYEGTVHDVNAGQRLLKAKLYDASQTPRRLAAEAVSQVSVPYPAELSPDQLEPKPEWLARLGESGTHQGPVDAIVTTPGDTGGRTRTKPLWPYVLFGLVLPLLVLDLLLRRVSLGVRRVDV
jgi:Mg-chelatase subunit ChlD/uncharacterized membrane protein